MKRGLLIFLVVLVAILWVLRIHFGVDFTDESWYIAASHRFLLGDRPYRDEIFLMQGASWLTTPIFWIYEQVFGTEGIVLFGRYCFLVFHALVAFTLFRTIRKVFPTDVSVILACCYFSFIPFTLPALGYNTLGLGFFVLGWCFMDERPLPSGLLHALAVLSHPTLIPAVGMSFLWFTISKRKDLSVKTWLFYAGSFFVTAFFVLLLAGATPSLLVDNFVITRGLNAVVHNDPGFQKVWAVVQSIAGYSLLRFEFLLLVFSLVLLRVFRPKALPLLAFLVVPFAFWISRGRLGGIGLHQVPIVLIWTGLLLWFLEKDPARKEIWMKFFMPSFLAGIFLSVTSYNGAGNAGVGWCMAALVTAGALGNFLKTKWAYVPALSLLVVILYFALPHVYSDDGLSALTTRVEAGPFKGLYTTSEKNEYLREVQSTVSRLSRPTGRIVFYSHFPAGYLMTQMRPGYPTTWGCLSVPPKICDDYYEAHQSPEDVAVHLKTIFYTKALQVEHRYHLGPIDEGKFSHLQGKIENQILVARHSMRDRELSSEAGN